MPTSLFSVVDARPRRLYLDESGTLGYSGELFTMAMVLVDDLPRLEASTAKHRTTQSEVKASQMKTSQKLALAHQLIAENNLQVFTIRLDPLASMVSERKIDKELLYDSMVAQALLFYLERGDLPRGENYRLSMDMRGGLRESYEDMVCESISNALMHRAEPLVSGIDVRFLDSRYSAGVQAADLFSNIYRSALTSRDTACQGFLRKYAETGVVHSGFCFGLPELADQMTQIAADLRARVELERARAGAAAADATGGDPFVAALEEGPASDDGAAEAVAPVEAEAGKGLSRSARRRRSRAARKDREAAEAAAAAEAGAPAPMDAAETAAARDAVPAAAPAGSQSAIAAGGAGAPEDASPATLPTERGARGDAEYAPAQPVKPAIEEGHEEAPAPRRRTRTRSANGSRTSLTTSKKAADSSKTAVAAEPAPAENAPRDEVPATPPLETLADAVVSPLAHSVEEAPLEALADSIDVRPGRSTRRARAKASAQKALSTRARARSAGEAAADAAQESPQQGNAGDAAAPLQEPPASETAKKSPAKRRSPKASPAKAAKEADTAADATPQEATGDEGGAAAPKRTRTRRAKQAEKAAGAPAAAPAEEPSGKQADTAAEKPADKPAKKPARKRASSAKKRGPSEQSPQPDASDA